MFFFAVSSLGNLLIILQTKSMVLNDLSTAERKAQLLAAEAADLTSQVDMICVYFLTT